jgi:nitrogen fixation protein NifU and related proteins
MTDLQRLYQQIVLDHYRHPRNYFSLAAARRAEVSNPLCGDQITLYLCVQDRRIQAVGFQGSGCAISQASASMMSTSLRDKTLAEAEALAAQFSKLLLGAGEIEIPLGELSALSAVRRFPARIECAALAWRALHKLLDTEAPLQHQSAAVASGMM